MERLYPFVLLGFLVLVLSRVYQYLSRPSIAHIPGPEPESFWLGNYREFYQSAAGETEFKWQARFGDVVRIKGPLGANRLLISDPKAIQYIFQASGYNFEKPPERRELTRVVSGRGLVWAAGEDHKRHKKILLPGFSLSAIEASTPIFFTYVSKLAGQWKDMISASVDQSLVLNILPGISRAALDAIGKIAFDYEFGTLDNDDDELGKAYENLVLDTFGTPGCAEIFFRNLLAYMPHFLRVLIADYAPSPKFKHARATAALGNRVAKSLLNIKSQDCLEKGESKDIMSLLVHANAAANEKSRLNEDELLSEIRTIISAGHETTANSLSWMFLELARHPGIQKKLRREIHSMERSIRSRGGCEFSLNDLDNMPYLNAFVKEGLRFHAVTIVLYRKATKDDVLPLSKPIVSSTGETLTALPIPRGLRIMTSVCAYNRNKETFGDDAHTFDPERWLDSRVKKSNSLGLVGNLMTFSGGAQSCIGWKFAMAEILAFLVELVGAFEFELTPQVEAIRRENSVIMVPTLPGQMDKGAQLPLRVRLAQQEDDF